MFLSLSQIQANKTTVSNRTQITQQQRLISGQVTYESRMPILGATVFVKEMQYVDLFYKY